MDLGVGLQDYALVRSRKGCNREHYQHEVGRLCQVRAEYPKRRGMGFVQMRDLRQAALRWAAGEEGDKPGSQ
jgi:hypothetical protein